MLTASRSSRTLSLLLWLVLGAGCGPAADTPSAAELAQPAAQVPLPAGTAPQPTASAPRPSAPETVAAQVENALLPLRSLGFPLEPNARVGAVDLDGDGRDEIAVAAVGALTLLKVSGDAAPTVAWRTDAPGGATAIGSGDLDGDGRADLVVGWGVHRDMRDAPARLQVYRTRDAAPGTLREEKVSAPRTPRAQFGSIRVTGLAPDGRPGILFTHFVSKYEVRGAHAEQNPDGSWRERELYTLRMGSLLTSLGSRGSGDGRRLVVGRSYGDETRSPGDVFLLGPRGQRTLLPSLRGLRSLIDVSLGPAAAPLELLCYGDGWHWRYRDEGRGRLTCARERPEGGFVAQLVALTDSYSLETLAPADLDGDGVIELIAQGADGIYRFTPVGSGDAGSGELPWTATKIGSGASHFAIADTDGDGRDEVIVTGERLGLLALP